MKLPFSNITLLLSLLATDLSLPAQNAAPAAASAGHPATPSLAVGQDAKEKAERAEDDALLRDMEANTPEPPEPVKKPRIRVGAANNNFGPVAVPYRLQNLVTKPENNARALLVRTTDPDPKTQSALEEDLAVMSHILNKAVDEVPGGQGNGTRVMGIDVFFAPGATPLRSLYLDNYGTVFFLGVSFPLVAPTEKRPDEKPTADSTWEDARQELYGRRGRGGVGEPAEEYSQEKVDKLKSTLLECLRNATNIRGLKPDEFVTLCVSGGSSSGTGKMRFVKANGGGNSGTAVLTTDQVSQASRRTVLTIRAGKADIDALASGKRSFEEFQKHVKVTTYTAEPGNGGGDSLIWGGGYAGKTRF